MVNATQEDVDNMVSGIYRVAGATDAIVKDQLTLRTSAPTVSTPSQQIVAYTTGMNLTGCSLVLDRNAANTYETSVELSGGYKDSNYYGGNGKARYIFSAGTAVVGTASGTAWDWDTASSRNGLYQLGYGESAHVYYSASSGVWIGIRPTTVSVRGGGGSIIVNGVSTHNTLVVRPATVTEHNATMTIGYKKLDVTPGHSVPGTFLVGTPVAASRMQNFAFDIDDIDD